ncbi:hypothetical protein GCM10027187_01290 [Streptosporangium sandarakinum]
MAAQPPAQRKISAISAPGHTLVTSGTSAAQPREEAAMEIKVKKVESVKATQNPAT